MTTDILSDENALELATQVRDGILKGESTHGIAVERLACYIIGRSSAAPAAALTEDSEIKAALHHLAEPGEVINTEWISRLLRRQLAPSAIERKA